MNVFPWLIVAVLLLVIQHLNIYIMRRNKTVSALRMEIIRLIHMCCNSDIDKHMDCDWKWRFDVFEHDVTYNQMLFQIWKPLRIDKLDVWYDDLSFVDPTKTRIQRTTIGGVFHLN